VRLPALGACVFAFEQIGLTRYRRTEPNRHGLVIFLIGTPPISVMLYFTSALAFTIGNAVTGLLGVGSAVPNPGTFRSMRVA
jgi:hypothetical protein